MITPDGFQVVRKSMPMDHWHDYATIDPSKVYFTYKEVEEDKKSYISELKRQASLSDEEWSMEQIAKTIGKYGKWRSLREEDKQQYVDFFKNLPNLADVETRISSEGLEWKYTKNKRWRPIRFPD